MTVYAPLQSYLSNRPDASIVMTYQEIEALLGRKLPPTAYGDHKRQWWANTETHSQALAWLRADRKARLDVSRERVTFVRGSGGVVGAPSATSQELHAIRLEGLKPVARRMLEDVAEEKGITLGEAAVTLLNHSALRRRANTLDWFAANTNTSSVSSIDLIRADRDGR